jgi:hypothetical protein
MGQAGSVLITRGIQKNLGLELQTAESIAVKNTILVHLKGRPDGATRFLAPAAASAGAQASKGRYKIGFPPFELFAQRHSVLVYTLKT